MGTPTNLTASMTEEQRHSVADLREADLDAKEKIRRLFELLPDPLFSLDDVAELLPAKTKAKKALEDALEALVEEDFLEKGVGTSKPLEGRTNLYRKKKVETGRLKVYALETKLGSASSDESPVAKSRFQFSIEGRFIRSIARVDRLLIEDSGSASGVQREEIRRHVQQIRAGVEGGSEVDNAVLLAIPADAIEVEPQEGDDVVESSIIIRPKSNWTKKTAINQTGREVELQHVRMVEIDFPFRNAMFDSEKSAILVDGQQRTAGILLADISRRPSIQVPANMIVGDESRAKSSFLISNSTVPIKKELLSALVADLDSEFVPGNLTRLELPSKIVKALALEDGPFKNLIAYSGRRLEKRAPIAHRTMMDVVSTFLESPALQKAQHEKDVQTLKKTIDAAFSEVKKAWPHSWGLDPKESRLMHGTGLRAISNHLVDLLKKSEPAGDVTAYQALVQASLTKLRTRVAWSRADFDHSTSDARDFYFKNLEGVENTPNSLKEVKKAFEFLLWEIDHS